MKRTKQVIFSADMAVHYPYTGSAATDLYYTKLANKLYYAIDPLINEEKCEDDFLIYGEHDIKKLAVLLTHYFEDIIAQTNLFTAFVTLYRKRYQRLFPFYSLDDNYILGEINTQDVRFIVWFYLFECNNCDFPITPVSSTIEQIAEEVMAILEEEYEAAPINTKMVNYIKVNDSDRDNLYLLKERMLWICTESYLHYMQSEVLQEMISYTYDQLKKEEPDENKLQGHLSSIVDLACTQFAYSTKTPLTASLPSEWMSEILGSDDPLYAPLQNLKPQIYGHFTYLSKQELTTSFLHLATNTTIEVSNRCTVGIPRAYYESNSILTASVCVWLGNYWFVGEVGRFEKNDELIAEIMNDPNELHAFDNNYVIEKEEEASIDSQKESVKKLLTRELEEGETETDRNWEILLDSSINTPLVLENISHIAFDGEQGKEVLHNDIDFVIDIIRTV